MKMLRWFGSKPFARICHATKQIDIPLDGVCDWCDEGFTADDHGVSVPSTNPEDTLFHGDCFLRTIFGSLGHQQGQCSCYGEIDTSEDGISRRQAATNAVMGFRERVANDLLGLERKPTVH